jgi:hypothetical protein
MVSALALVLAASAHPLHSSLTTVVWRPETHTIDLAVRVFTQDLQDALAHRTGTACDYARAVLTLRDATGTALSTVSCTTAREGDVTWIRMSAPAASPRGVRLANAVLFDTFPDQINIVQASLDGQARTVLFTRGDGPKALT